MRTVNVLVAEQIIRDAATNKISAINLVEDMNIVAFPFVLPTMAIMFFLAKESADGDVEPVTLSLVCNGEQVQVSSSKAQFAGRDRARMLVNIANAEFTSPGYMKFTLRKDSDESVIGEYTIRTKAKSEMEFQSEMGFGITDQGARDRQ